MPNLTTSHDPLLVACSLLIAGFACYAALEASMRLRSADKRLALRWWIAGALATGSGLWAANFTALLALALPIPLGYGVGLTAASWLAAVAASPPRCSSPAATSSPGLGCGRARWPSAPAWPRCTSSAWTRWRWRRPSIGTGRS